jgi:hypothetical protein
MPNINDQFPSKYLRASDFDEEGAIVTIASVRQETMKNRDGRDEIKPILFFREHEQGLVLNKTNAKKISTLLKSEDTDDWVDAQVRIYATETQFGADTVACLRFRQAALPTKKQDARRSLTPQQAGPAQAVEADDPF